MGEFQLQFNRFPPEIQRQILNHALVAPSDVVVWAVKNHTLQGRFCDRVAIMDHGPTACSLKGVAMGLLGCNHSIGSQAAQIFYSENTFSFFGNSDLCPLISWLYCIGERNRSFISNISDFPRIARSSQIRLETLQQPEGYPHKHSQHNSRLRDVPHLSCDYSKRIFNRKSFNGNDDDDIGLNSIYRTDTSVLMRQLRRWHNDHKVILRIHLADPNLSDRLNYEKPLPTSFGVRGRLTARKSAAPILNRHDTIRYRWLLHHNASFEDSNILLVWEAAIWPDPNTGGSRPATYRQRAAFRDAGWELLRETEVETPAAGQSSDGPEDMEQKLRITIARQDRPGGLKSRLPPFSESLDRLAMEADRDIECGECPACKKPKAALDDEEE